MTSMYATRRASALAIALALCAPALAQDGGAGTAAAPVLESETMPLATSQGLVLDFTETGSRAIAVGERGQVLVSESRTDWRQVEKVPTRANLTAVAAVGEHAWAVGHDGTIVHSADGGLSWTLQRQDPWRPQPDDEPFNPRQGVPLLDVLMLDAREGFAVGAYSLMLRTRDGGQSWEEVGVLGSLESDARGDVIDDGAAVDDGPGNDADDWTFDQSDLELEEEADPHFNAITRTGDGSLFVVAERGAAFRSRDGGETWERLQLPYEGSMFGVIGYDGQHVLAFGMRGNAFESHDLGDSWQQLDTGTDLSLMGGAALPGGGAVLVGANGLVLVRTAQGAIGAHTYQTRAQETPVLAGVLAQSASSLVVGGEKGVGTFQVQAR